MYPETDPPTTKKYNDYVYKFRERLEWAYRTAQAHIENYATCRKQYYDRKFHCMEIIPGDIVLVRQKVFGTTRKIEDRWENPVYRVVEKMGDGPVYKIQKLGEHGEKSFLELHRNMLHPLMQVVEEPGEAQERGNESDEADSPLNKVSKQMMEKGQMARSPDKSGDSHNFEGVVGRMNINQKPECITVRRNGVQTKWSHVPNGEYRMS